jgi:hypothetical protein
MESHNNG